MTNPSITISVDAPLDIHFNAATQSLSLTCHQFASDGTGLAMRLELTPQATQQMLQALEYLQTQHGVSSAMPTKPHGVQ
ncbi:hypothetical protein GJV52_00885 [Neisseria brasiliensis]|uniref:Uncharacterized protein n=1 Tax=Neisseria brasiliensis TaxID=2666100 RepID=A0A5Q3RXY7_9NEIS|nr:MULTISPECIES: hypothetical protein [Neisseria]MRN37222.1 hypothetical protein [Neisseria brasiliensis]QGL24233.1 hypothetical protein GJV52_00885 [Neisseria brasiliensis]